MNELIDNNNIRDVLNDLLKEFHLTPDKLKKLLTQDAKRKEYLKHTQHQKKQKFIEKPTEIK